MTKAYTSTLPDISSQIHFKHIAWHLLTIQNMQLSNRPSSTFLLRFHPRSHCQMDCGKDWLYNCLSKWWKPKWQNTPCFFLNSNSCSGTFFIQCLPLLPSHQAMMGPQKLLGYQAMCEMMILLLCLSHWVHPDIPYWKWMFPLGQHIKHPSYLPTRINISDSKHYPLNTIFVAIFCFSMNIVWWKPQP